MQREILLMGAMGDTSDDGWFGGTPFDLSSDNVKAEAQKALDDPAYAQQIAQANGVSSNYVRAAASQATGAIPVPKNEPSANPGSGMTTVTATIDRSSTVLKAGVIAGLLGGIYYVGKHRGWF